MNEPVPFRSADEAWWWYCLMQAERRAGHKSSGSGPGRPCDIDDVALAFNRLRRSKRILNHHVEVMVRYGHAQRPPDRRIDPRGLQAWNEGIDALHTLLAQKNIIEVVNNC
jgi:hypothetical protein